MIPAQKEHLETIRLAPASPENLPDNGNTNAVRAQTNTDKTGDRDPDGIPPFSKNQGGRTTKDTLLTPEQQSEIDDQRSLLHQTRRATVPALEDLLYLSIPLLDHGFIRPIDYMGDDAAIVQAARVSYGRGTRRISDDRGLIRYLMRHHHTTPFEMCEIKLHCKIPIFVARQWVRHRTANLNEYSARYSILDREFYIPSQEVMAAQSQTNRQGREQQLSEEEAQWVQELLTQDAMRAYDHYGEMLNEGLEGQSRDPSRTGLARELARMNLSLNYYTQWYWKIDLHNLMNFLRLRADPHAQHEIRVYADAILYQLVQPWVPLTHQAFLDYQLHARTFSAQEMALLKTLVGKHQAELEELRPTAEMSLREWKEMLEVLSQEG